MSFIPPKFIQNLSLPLLKLAQSGASTGQTAVWNGSQWAPGAPHFTAFTSATQTSTSTTPANITELGFASIATGIYRWDTTIIFQSTATGTGIGFRMNVGTAVANFCNGTWSIVTGGNGTDRFFQYDQIGLATNVTTGSVPTANADFIAQGFGFIDITTAGGISLQFRSESTTAVSVRANSVLTLTRVGNT